MDNWVLTYDKRTKMKKKHAIMCRAIKDSVDSILAGLAILTGLAMVIGGCNVNNHYDRQVKLKAIEALSKNVELKVNTSDLKELLR